MAKLNPIQTNFTAGELSPRVGSRIDVAKYNNGVKTGENCEFLVQGGARRRPGLRHVAEVKDSTKRTRLVPFIYNRDQAYILEFGDGYMRVFKNGLPVGAPYEIASPYSTSLLDNLAYVQGADTMFLANEAVQTHRLQRFADAEWRLLPAVFSVEPFDEMGVAPAAGLTLSAATVGTGRTATAAAASFLDSDVGRDIVYGSGLATVTAYTSTTVVTVEVKSAFSGTALPSGGWSLEGSPQTTCTVNAVGPVGAAVTVTLGLAGWRAGTAEVGKYVKVNGGLVKLTSYSSSTIMNGVVQQVLTSTTAAIANSWSLNSSIWGGVNGYPRAVTLHEQRLLLGGTPRYPQSLMGSRIGDVLNYELGTKDDDAFNYELSTSQIAPIQHLAQARRLMVFTSSNEMSVRGGVEKPITPTSIQKNDESTAGANTVRPVKVGNELLFVQRAGRKIRACGYRYDIDGFDSPDRTVFSEHITETGIVDMAFQQEPSPMVHCVRTDGQMAVATYDIEQEVIAWGRWITDGVVESVATIPTSTSEQAWVIVRRTINGVTRRYVEYFDPALKTDCAKTLTAGSPQTVWTGLGHLEGKTVKVIADGVYAGEKTVTAGQIVLDEEASSIEVGLGFTPLITLLNPEVGSQAGTSQGAAISVNSVTVRVLDTVGVVINGRQKKDFRKLGANLLDRPPEMGSGDLRETTLSDQIYRNELTLSQPDPVAFHILGVVRQMGVNT